ncbi:CoA-transferase [Mycobacterium intracellulare subsp. chimaera]|nr:CoA transferase [Mycobacterium intracellulare subsp. chimaera]ETZ36025.1 coA-transferase III family protein [Mycobacterium intracellulare MIN_052511_1280]KPN47658.1 CoA-transferase [Mycobacterium intracellulare subsp. chimaera]KPN48974.1 CoA-transferase [Mycobacterium intracellulare subsp. chimaera]
MESLFDGLTILELGHVIAAPFAASLMGDFGAQIIKIEDPGRGDMLRNSGPAKDGVHLWWKSAARNKSSVAIDLRTSKGQALVRKMTERVDVVIENFRPGTLERWDLGWKHLHAANSRLVMLRISGYGQIGPESAKPGYGRVGEAMSGAVQITGHPDRPPTHFGFSLGDITTGIMGAFAVAGALFKRESIGNRFDGECIDLALYESLFRGIDWQIILFDQLNVVAERQGNQYPVSPSPVSDTYLSRDGLWFTVATGTVRSVHNLLELIGGKELRHNPKYATQELQMLHRQELGEMVRRWFADNTSEIIEKSCASAGVVASPIFTPADMFSSPTFRARANIAEVADADLGRIHVTGVVPQLMNFPGSVRSSGPRLGNDGKSVLTGWLGLTDSEYEALVSSGVVGSVEPDGKDTAH